MIISRTPVRISFLGGGTDYPDYFRHHGGATLGASIDKYTTITVHKLTRFADCRLRVHYSQLESVQSIDEIRHPSARECLRFLGIDEGLEIHYISDLPARTGLGSSSSATVGLLMALHAFKGETVSQQKVAQEAVYIEQEMIRERVGCQDQYTCALGGLLHLEFQKGGGVRANPMSLSVPRLQELNQHLLLLYTGTQRNAHEVLDEQIQRTQSGQNSRDLAAMKDLVSQGIEILTSGQSLIRFGELLHEGWRLKRGLSQKVSTSLIDDAYARARGAGAVGGKLLGAGGGGFLLLFVRPAERARVKQAVPELREAPFQFESSGSTIIFHRL